ncbi:SoxR reducing system RseC family protein [Oceanimonas sp. CHS3-5]|uniref:SoxR reducing system RseC family protein n=1 Tax=Oceanimonas sp. CHS3-5 TaxID=3068186 RepID=UPI00273EF5CB|nr:SoxR reducing system RseC family protein [Oceanimonas sp. CHS3-5]MDP5293066.1 SoxR reducing system RseC family protein [Oceanimonas sp. CHS3-5]
MIEEIATVTAVHDGRVEVSCFSKSACGQCRQSSTCGTGLVSKALPGRDHRFVIATELTLQPGQQVRIGIPEQSLITGALLVYLLPLLCLLTGGLVAGWAGLGEGASIVGALAGGGLGFALASRLSRRRGHDQPVILGSLLPVARAD